MKVLFVCSSDLRSPSEKQAHWLASYMAARGHRTLISLGGSLEGADAEGAGDTPGVELRRHRLLGRRLSGADREAARALAPDLIHAWNPRAPVIAAARSYSTATGAPVLVHWEDDEWQMAGGHGTVSASRRIVRAGRRLAGVLAPSAWYQATASSIGWAIREGAAFDALTPILARYVGERTGRECAVILPPLPVTPEAEAAPPEIPEPIASRPLVTLTGALLPSRVGDVRLALEGAAEARRQGADLAFVLAGRNLMGVAPEALAAKAGIPPDAFAYLGHVSYRSIPALLRDSAVLLAVSLPTDLNIRSLPSKLQSYLVSGTPTVVSAHGAGELFKPGEVLKLERPEPVELGELIARLMDDPALAARLASGGRRAARRLFDPDRNTAAMLDHYRRALRLDRQPR